MPQAWSLSDRQREQLRDLPSWGSLRRDRAVLKEEAIQIIKRDGALLQAARWEFDHDKRKLVELQALGFNDFDVVTPLPEDAVCHVSLIAFGKHRGRMYQHVRDTCPGYCVNLLSLNLDVPAVQAFVQHLSSTPHDFVLCFGRHKGKRYGDVAALDQEC